MSKRIAYVTGGMGGIGTAICTRLCKDGYTVVAGCGPNSTRKDTWLATMRAHGYDIHASEGNVSDWESTKAALRRRSAPRSAKWTCSSTTPASPATASSAR
jgi:Dehydrogenases with different specificities (related to short-chain alcohol dehydrogenases)